MRPFWVGVPSGIHRQWLSLQRAETKGLGVTSVGKQAQTGALSLRSWWWGVGLRDQMVVVVGEALVILEGGRKVHKFSAP